MKEQIMTNEPFATKQWKQRMVVQSQPPAPAAPPARAQWMEAPSDTGRAVRAPVISWLRTHYNLH